MRMVRSPSISEPIPAKISDATKAILELVEKIKKEGVDPERVKRAKAQMKTGTVYSRQTAENIAESLADGYITARSAFRRSLPRTNPQARTQRTSRPSPSNTRYPKAPDYNALARRIRRAAGLPKAQQIVASAATTQAAPAESAGAVDRFVLDNGNRSPAPQNGHVAYRLHPALFTRRRHR